MYIKRRRFGEFVNECIEAENQRKRDEEEKENEQHLWMMYVHSMSGKSFNDWKAEVLKPAKKSRDETLTNDDIVDIINGLFAESK